MYGHFGSAVLIILLSSLACPEPTPPDPATPRIVSAAPSLTEISFALGLDGEVVGVSNFCSYPEAATTRARVGDYLRPNVERILALNPTLILLDDVQQDVAKALRQTGRKVLSLPMRNLADVRSAITAVGKATQRETAARNLLSQMDREMAEAPRLQARPSVLIIVGRDPGTFRNLYAAAADTYPNDLLRLAGGRNVLSEEKGYARLSVETLLSLSPQIIAEIVDRGVDPAAARAAWSEMPQIPAVRDRRVHVTNDQLLTTPGPRAPAALKSLVETIEKRSP